MNNNIKLWTCPNCGCNYEEPTFRCINCGFDKSYKVITVLGSTKFRKEINEWAWEKTKKGYLVLTAPFAKEEIPELENYRVLLEGIHYQKIRICDIVFVFNKDLYIGESTNQEIQYAIELEKEIKYLSDEK